MKKNIVPLFFLLSALFFIHRPFFFDDGSVVLSSVAAAKSPLRPYDFTLDLDVVNKPAWPVQGLPSYTHPPLTAWYLALPTHLFGPRPIPYHAAMFLIAILALIVFKKLAERVTANINWTTAVFAFSPGFFLTSLTLYPHLLYIFFYLTVILTCLKFSNDNSPLTATLLGLGLGCAALSLHQWPILFALAGLIAFSRSPELIWRRGPFVLLTIFLTFGIWSIWEAHVYGKPGFVASYIVRVNGSRPYSYVAAFIPLVFLTGTIPLIGLSWPYLHRKSQVIPLSLAVLLILAFALFVSPWGGFNRLQSVVLAFECVTGLAWIIGLVFLFREGDRIDRFLILWFAAEYLFVQKFLTHASGHHMLPLVVSSALILGRLVGKLGWPESRKWTALAAQALLTLVLAQADTSQAHVGPTIAQAAQRHSDGENYFWGNSFGAFEYDLKQAGWKAFDVNNPWRPGDYLLIPKNLNAGAPPNFLLNPHVRLVQKIPTEQINPLRTFSLRDSAGWYSASWGALPYSWGKNPVEEFMVLRNEGH